MVKNRRVKSSKDKQLQKYYDFLAVPTLDRKIASGSLPTPKRSSISDELERAQKLKNDDAEQDIQLKKITLNRLFKLLVSETIVIFIVSFMQATHVFHFALEEWSFKLLTSVTITQITVMLFVAVSYLFPKKRP